VGLGKEKGQPMNRLTSKWRFVAEWIPPAYALIQMPFHLLSISRILVQRFRTMLFEKVFTLPVAIQAENLFDLIRDQRPPSSVYRL